MQKMSSMYRKRPRSLTYSVDALQLMLEKNDGGLSYTLKLDDGKTCKVQKLLLEHFSEMVQAKKRFETFSRDEDYVLTINGVRESAVKILVGWLNNIPLEEDIPEDHTIELIRAADFLSIPTLLHEALHLLLSKKRWETSWLLEVYKILDVHSELQNMKSTLISKLAHRMHNSIAYCKSCSSEIMFELLTSPDFKYNKFFTEDTIGHIVFLWIEENQPSPCEINKLLSCVNVSRLGESNQKKFKTALQKMVPEMDKEALLDFIFESITRKHDRRFMTTAYSQKLEVPMSLIVPMVKTSEEAMKDADHNPEDEISQILLDDSISTEDDSVLFKLLLRQTQRGLGCYLMVSKVPDNLSLEVRTTFSVNIWHAHLQHFEWTGVFTYFFDKKKTRMAFGCSKFIDMDTIQKYAGSITMNLFVNGTCTPCNVRKLESSPLAKVQPV